MSIEINFSKGLMKGNCKVRDLRKVGMIKASMECQEANDKEENFRRLKPFKGFSQ